MKTILIIENSPIGGTLSTSINADQRQILKAYTLAEALKHLMQNDVDVILLEELLPDGAGYDYLIKFKSTPHIAQIPIIFIVGDKHSLLDINRAQEAGAEVVMLNAVVKEELNKQIDAVLWSSDASFSGFPAISVAEPQTEIDAEALGIYVNGNDAAIATKGPSDPDDSKEESVIELPESAILSDLEDEQATEEKRDHLLHKDDLSMPASSMQDPHMTQKNEEKQSQSLSLSIASKKPHVSPTEALPLAKPLSSESFLATAKPYEKQGFQLPLGGVLKGSKQDDAVVFEELEENEEKQNESSQLFNSFVVSDQVIEPVKDPLEPVVALSAEEILETAKPLQKHGFDFPLAGALPTEHQEAVELSSAASLGNDEEKPQRSSMAFSIGKVIQAQEKQPSSLISMQTPEAILETAKPFQKHGFSLPLGRIVKTGDRKTIELEPILEQVRDAEFRAKARALEFSSQDIVAIQMPVKPTETSGSGLKRAPTLVENVDKDEIKEEIARLTRMLLPEIINDVLKKLIASELAPKIQHWIDKRVESIMLEEISPQLKVWLNDRVVKLLASHLDKDGEA